MAEKKRRGDVSMGKTYVLKVEGENLSHKITLLSKEDVIQETLTTIIRFLGHTSTYLKIAIEEE